MRHEAKKISKLVDELLTYFLHHYNAAAEIEVTPGPDAYRLRMRFSGLTLNDDTLARLRQRLQVKRQPELEDYYWQLAGESDDSNELMLLGMMCDRIELRRAGPDAITIELLRRMR
ncbi:MAG: hypothetical protein K9N49_06115 [Candidatus Marinimicrobia bacterium]|nr:hypothetical protein [Candidatus Neomarinimicrobiota bacterium]